MQFFVCILDEGKVCMFPKLLICTFGTSFQMKKGEAMIQQSQKCVDGSFSGFTLFHIQKSRAFLRPKNQDTLNELMGILGHYLFAKLISFFQDGDILLTPNARSDRTQTLLLIPNLQIEDAGTYWCKSRNVWGEVNATFPVKIYGE